MQILPKFDEFRRLADSVRFVPVTCEFVCDALTPVEAYARIRRGNSSFLFESVVGGERVGRYSFVGSDPFRRLVAYGQEVVEEIGNVVSRRTVADPLAEVEALVNASPGATLPMLPRFTGGAVGYAGYDTVRYVESLPRPPQDDRKLPDLSFSFHDHMVVFDHVRKTMRLVVLADVSTGSLEEAYTKGSDALRALAARLDQPGDPLSIVPLDLDVEPTTLGTLATSREQYEAMVTQAKEYIRAGDIFQVVLSRRTDFETDATPLDIYRILRIVNPSPFMFLLETPEVQLVGSSPEIMVRVEDREVTIRPLAGTRPRGKSAAEDDKLEQDLLADEKERAEHVMLVDLARNDVGRVAEYGSVVLNDVMQVERYSHVMHITSNVTGKLREEFSALDALRSGLPAGTVSGAPKVRAMQIIDELESYRRGPYAGAVGYLDFSGQMDTCIALRTLVMQGKKAWIQAGAGIVADSDPAVEFQETVNKARALLKAVTIAQTQLPR